jgi:membrane-associated phospholipid phosphatase
MALSESEAFIIALVIFVVFAFPRVMIGAHWFTDIAVGSLSADINKM